MTSENNNENDILNEQESLTVDIGQHLKNARENIGIDINEMSRRTKIGTTMLSLLEQGDLHALPNKAYVTGYVKAYCKELNINFEQTLDLLSETYVKLEITNNYESTVEKFYENESSQLINYKSFLIPFALILITGALYFTFKNNSKNNTKKIEAHAISEKTPLKKTKKVKALPVKIKKIESNSTAEVKKPAEQKKEIDKQTSKKEQGENVVKEPLKQNEKKIDKKDSIKLNTEKKDSVIEKKSVKTKEIKFMPISKNLYEINENQPSKAELNKIIPASMKQIFKKGFQNIFIKAETDNSWLTYKVDKQPIVKTLVKKGSTLLIQGKEVRAFFGNINAIKIFYNGNLIKTPSVTSVKSLVFPISSYSKYSFPLFIYHNDGKVETSEEYIKNNR